MPIWPWTRATPGRREPARAYEHLVPGWRYRVAKAFVDHDDIVHPAGETWTFTRADVLPHEDGLSLFVMRDDGAADQIRLQRRPAAEQAVTNALHDHLTPETRTPGRRALLLTRDSVCLADDIDAPHAAPLDIARDADAADVAWAILDAGYLAWTGSATWTLSLGADRVVFGWRLLHRFVAPVDPGPFHARAAEVGTLHVFYHAQAECEAVIEALRARPGWTAR